VGTYRGYRVFPFGQNKRISEIFAQIEPSLPDAITIVANRENLILPLGFEAKSEPSTHHKMILREGIRTRPSFELNATEGIRLLTQTNSQEIEHLKAQDKFQQISPRFTERLSRKLPYYGLYVMDKLVAVAGCYGLSHEFEIANIGDIYVHPEHRKKGYAHALVSVLVETLIGNGAGIIGCDIAENEQPIGPNSKPAIFNLLTQKIGFEHDGDIYYQDALRTGS